MDYAHYLKLKELLSLQQPLSDKPEHDELLFIIIHQSYELWFKQIIHELDHLILRFAQNETDRALKTLERILTIFKMLVSKLDILETMTPLDFLGFRARLESASGVQSYQFRALELILGKKDKQALARFKPDSAEYKLLYNRLIAPSLWHTFLEMLVKQGYDIPKRILARDPEKSTQSSSKVQACLVRLYRSDPALMQLCESMVDLDEGIQEWRYRHVKMVERTIGVKFGTGGSSGASYLIQTLFRPFFPDLWEIRSEF